MPCEHDYRFIRTERSNYSLDTIWHEFYCTKCLCLVRTVITKGSVIEVQLPFKGVDK